MLDSDLVSHLASARMWCRNWGKNPNSIKECVRTLNAPVWTHNALYLDMLCGVISGHRTHPEGPIWDEFYGVEKTPEEIRIENEKRTISNLISILNEWSSKNGDDLLPFLEYWHIPNA